MAACTAAPEPKPDKNALDVKITGVELFRIDVNSRGPWLIVRLQTDAGVTGLGDASHSGKGDPAYAKVEEYVEFLKGRSVFDLEAFRAHARAQHPEGKRAVSCALSGLEQACYDIQGKLMGVPCWALFGGKLRDEVRNYANINRATDVRTRKGSPRLPRAPSSRLRRRQDGLLRRDAQDGSRRDRGPYQARGRLHQGRPRSPRPGPRPARRRTQQLRLQPWARPVQTTRTASPFWLEEVSRPLDVWAKLSAEAPMTTAGGEGLFGVKEFWPYLKADACDIMMPDVKYCGGMLELKKISAMSEAAGDHPVAPHGPSSPIGNMAAAHVCVTIPNFSILEFSHGDALEWRADMTIPPEPMGKGGMLRVPDTPGLGYELNEKVVRPRLVS
ncbi:MAG: mandelate racemase/muconate lactonizing enzyme family protein [Bryobacterales bacterium]